MSTPPLSSSHSRSPSRSPSRSSSLPSDSSYAEQKRSSSTANLFANLASKGHHGEYFTIPPKATQLSEKIADTAKGKNADTAKNKDATDLRNMTSEVFNDDAEPTSEHVSELKNLMKETENLPVYKRNNTTNPITEHTRDSTTEERWFSTIENMNILEIALQGSVGSVQ